MNENTSVKGYVTVEVIRKNGQKEVICENKPNLVTTAGIDFLHLQGYDKTGLSSNGANYIALTTDAADPDVGDTTLTGEIASGGLERAQGTITHTPGSTSTTIFKEFTASGSFTGVRKSGLFTAASVGVMVHENTFTSVNLESGDLIRVTWTINLS